MEDDTLNNPFQTFDYLISKLDTFPLDMQYHITNIQRLDNKIIRYNKKFDSYFKRSLKRSSLNHFTKIKCINEKIKVLLEERSYSLRIATKILKKIHSNMTQLIPDDLKEPLPTQYKQSSILKTQLEKSDIPMNIKQPKYCICKQPAYGDMIRCDGIGCKILWFHFKCVKLYNSPKTNWYCMGCRKKI